MTTTIATVKLTAAAEILGLSTRGAESALKRAKITSGYPLAAVIDLAARGPRQGERTDLKPPTPPVDLAVITTVDDSSCGVRILWDRQAYIIEGLETGHTLARTASPDAVVVHVAAELISYGTDADGDWSRTVAQGEAMLDDRDHHVQALIDARDDA